MNYDNMLRKVWTNPDFLLNISTKYSDFLELSHDCIESFDTIFNDVHKYQIKTKFTKHNQSQIEHIYIHKFNIRCYILDLPFIIEVLKRFLIFNYN